MGKKVELGINNSFAIKKWVEPEEWTRVIVEEIGLNNIQLSFDLFYPSLKESNVSFMCNEINIAVKKYNSKISSTFTGLNTYSQNMLGHPNPVIRKSALDYYIDAIKISSKTNVPITGGHFLAFTIKDFNNKKTREYLMQSLFEAIIYLSKVAYDYNLKSLTLEYMATPYELPHTIKEAKKIALKSAGREAKKDNWYAYLVTDPKAFVDDFGGVRFKAGTTCERLGQI